MQGMVPAAGASPRSTGRNVWGHPVVFGAYRRRDTQVPPYELCRQSVGECRAAPVCAAVRCGGDDDRRIPANPYPMYQPPGGAEGPKALSPQQCEAWIEGAAALFQNHRTKPLKKLKIPKLKSFTRFFSKNRRGPGGGAPGRPPQRAKYPRLARRETPAGRSQRNTRPPQRAKLPLYETYIFSGAEKPSRSMDCSRTARVKSMRAM